MDKQQAKLRKQILSDPIAAFHQQHGNASKEQASALELAWHDYVALKQQHKSMQNQCKKLSRQIGQAKRAGSAVDVLVETMQTQTAGLNMLQSQLDSMADSILAFFETGDRPQNTDTKSAVESNRHADTGMLKSEDKIAIKQLTDEHEVWNSYVETNPAASIYHRTEWRTLIHEVFGHEGYYLLAHNSNQEVVGVLPLVRLKSRLFGDFMVSMPYFNYGGAVADTPSIESRLIRAANDLAKDLGVSHIEYRDDIQREGLPVKTDKVNMLLALPKTREQLWQGFTSKLRSQIKRPQREDTQIHCGGEECLDDFYRIFARNMRDLGTPVYAKSFFQKILCTFTEQSRILVLYLHKQPVAAAFLLGYKGTLEIPWASTIRDVNHLSINMLLYWEVLNFAIENNYKYFDFGRSSKESGTYRFKQQWGAKPKQLYWHYWLANNDELPSLNPNNPKFALAINIWKRLPVEITKWVGPYIVRNLP